MKYLIALSVVLLAGCNTPLTQYQASNGKWYPASQATGNDNPVAKPELPTKPSPRQ